MRHLEICKKFNITKQYLQYDLSSLKRSGFIRKIGYGVWETFKDFDEKKFKRLTVLGKRIGKIVSLEDPINPTRLRKVLEEEGSKVLITGLTSARIIENHL